MADFLPPDSLGDGRQGWFEGVREGRLQGWAYLPSDPHRVLEVTLTAGGGATLCLRADHYRADLQALGLTECCHGFSAPLAALPGAETYAQCLWTDLGLPLPGARTAPRGRPRRVRKGSMRLSFDTPPAGDPRLTGSAYDANSPLRRIKLRANWGVSGGSSTVASLYRGPNWGSEDDGFHGFILPLPAALRMLRQGLAIFDADHERLLVRLGPASL